MNNRELDEAKAEAATYRLAIRDAIAALADPIGVPGPGLHERVFAAVKGLEKALNHTGSVVKADVDALVALRAWAQTVDGWWPPNGFLAKDAVAEADKKLLGVAQSWMGGRR